MKQDTNQTSVGVVDIDIDELKTSIKVSAGKGAAAEHQRITNRLGLFGAQPINQLELEHYLHDNGYDVYPLGKVVEYMDGKVNEVPKQVITKKIRMGHWGRRTRTTTTTRKAKWRWILIQDAVQVIPVEVLMTCEKIINDLGARVDLEVTEIYESVTTRSKESSGRPLHMDPFLCVTAPGCPKFVIERWDEPAFRR